MIDEVQRGVHDLAEVVRWDVGGHADSDAATAVDQQVRVARGENDRLFVVSVVRFLEVDGVLVDLAEQLHRQRRQSRLCVVVDEAVRKKSVIVRVDLHRVHRLHTGVLHRGDFGVVPATRDERRDDFRDFGILDAVEHLAAKTAVPPLHRRDVVLLQPLPVVAPCAALGSDVVGQERDVVCGALAQGCG